MLVNDGGGGGDPYQIKINSVAPGSEEDSMGYQEIMQLLHGLKPGDVTAAAAAFKKLGETLDRITTALMDQGNQLADNWSGEAASKAMAKFQQLHDQAAQLAAQAHTTAQTMDWMGSKVMPKFQSLPSPSVMGHGAQAAADAAAGNAIVPGAGAVAGAIYGGFFGPDGTAKADQAARGYMKAFNQAMTQANSQLPASTVGPGRFGNQQFTPNQGTSGTSSTGSGSGSSYAGVGGTNGTGGSAPSSYTPPSGAGPANLASLNQGNNNPSGAPHNYNPAGTLSSYHPGGSLANYSGGTSNPPAGGPPGNLSPSNPNPFQPVPVGAGGGYGSGKSLSGEGDGIPGENGLGKNGPISEEGVAGGKALGENGAPGEGLGSEGTGGADAAAATGAEGTAADGAASAAGEAAGAQGAAGAAEGEGMNAMPMGGMGAGGDSGKERQRQAWMNEDESIWGAPTEETGSVIE